MRYLAATLLLAATFTTGCHITSDQHGDGDNVKVATPFGGLSVKTDEGDVLSGIGLPLYPGATPVKKDKINGKDNGSADVNMSFGSFQLRVKAAEYRSNDAPDKLLTFYKKALGRYGNVIQCEDHRPVGTPSRTAEGLTCDENEDHGDRKIHINVNDNQKDGGVFHGNAKMQLKAGSRKHQHIVDIDPDGTGAKLGLVALDLPVDFHFGDKNDKDSDEDKEKDKQ